MKLKTRNLEVRIIPNHFRMIRASVYGAEFGFESKLPWVEGFGGHGNKFERISSNFNFEWTKFEFSKNRNKFESLCSNFEQTAVSIKRTSDISPIHLVPRGPSGPLMFILLSEVEQEQRPSGNGDREAVVVGAGLCDGEGERAYTGNAPH